MPGDAMEDVIFQYDGSFPGFLCCVFDSYAHKEFPIAFYSDEECVSLYPVRVVVTRRDHSQRVYDSLQRLSPPALKALRRAWLTCLEDKELRLYAFIRKLYDQGPGFMRSQADDVYYPIACALRHLGGELEKLRGFVRFSDYNGILGGEIQRTGCSLCWPTTSAAAWPGSPSSCTTAPTGSCCCTPRASAASSRWKA